tara:strand:- start:368 stop:991 length:624 start_codon:yes stop_codon:yes gene_type:complete
MSNKSIIKIIYSISIILSFLGIIEFYSIFNDENKSIYALVCFIKVSNIYFFIFDMMQFVLLSRFLLEKKISDRDNLLELFNTNNYANSSIIVLIMKLTYSNIFGTYIFLQIVYNYNFYKKLSYVSYFTSIINMIIGLSYIFIVFSIIVYTIYMKLKYNKGINYNLKINDNMIEITKINKNEEDERTEEEIKSLLSNEEDDNKSYQDI